VNGLATFLDLLFGAEPPGAYAELRWRLRGGMGQEFLPVRRRRRLAESILERGAKTDVYIGVAPRSRQEGTRAAVSRSHVVWVDADTPEAVEAIIRFQPAASMIVCSGHGVHGYWSILPPTGADETEHANRKLAAAIGGDSRATDAARILRPPGTANFKRVDAPRPVTVERVEVEVYEVEQVVGHLAEIHEPTPKGGPPPHALVATDEPLLAIPATLYVEALTGLVAGADGKVVCPFHDDSTPSLHVYPGDGGWACFGCGRGGTVIDFGAALFGIEPRGRGYHEIRRRVDAELRQRAAT